MQFHVLDNLCVRFVLCFIVLIYYNYLLKKNNYFELAVIINCFHVVLCFGMIIMYWQMRFQNYDLFKFALLWLLFLHIMLIKIVEEAMFAFRVIFFFCFL